MRGLYINWFNRSKHFHSYYFRIFVYYFELSTKTQLIMIKYYKINSFYEHSKKGTYIFKHGMQSIPRMLILLLINNIQFSHIRSKRLISPNIPYPFQLLPRPQLNVKQNRKMCKTKLGSSCHMKIVYVQSCWIPTKHFHYHQFPFKKTPLTFWQQSGFAVSYKSVQHPAYTALKSV